MLTEPFEDEVDDTFDQLGGDYVLDLNTVGQRMRTDPRFQHLFLGGR